MHQIVLYIASLYYLPPLFFKFCFFGWICDHTRSNVLICLMILWTKLVKLWYWQYLDTFILCVLGNKESNLLKFWHRWQDFLLVLSYLISHTDKNIEDTGTNSLTHIYKYIVASPVTYTQQLLVLQWMNNLLIQKLQCHCFSKITHL